MTDTALFRLVDLTYDAALDPPRWQDFLAGLSAETGGAATALTLALPRLEHPALHFVVGLRSDSAVLLRHLATGLPWGDPDDPRWRERFVRCGEVLADEHVRDTAFYREWMAPQGLAPEGPIGHVIHADDGVAMAALCLFRRDGGPPIGDRDLARLDRLVPHLARAYAIYRTLGGAERERTALGEVLDRLPTSVIIVDESGRVLVVNRAAGRALAAGDLLRVDGGVLRAASPSAEAELGGAIARAARREHTGGTVVFLPRGGARRGATAVVTALLEPLAEAALPRAAASIVVRDPEASLVATPDALAQLYGLSPAEAELLALIVGGATLEEASKIRGVAVGTARKQLAQVFQKTATHRQSELVELVLRGVGLLDR